MATYRKFPFAKAKNLTMDKQQALATALFELIQTTPDKAVQLLDTLNIHLYPSDNKPACLVFDVCGQDDPFPIMMELEFTETIIKLLTGIEPSHRKTERNISRDINKSVLEFPYTKARSLNDTTKAALASELVAFFANDKNKQLQLLATINIHLFPSDMTVACIAFDYSGNEEVTPILSEFELLDSVRKSLEGIEPDSERTTISFADEDE